MRRPVASPDYPRPLEPDEVAVLRWLGESVTGRSTRDCPDGMDFALAAATRRALVKLCLVTLDCPPNQPAVYLLTAAGAETLRTLIAAQTPQPQRKAHANRGRSRIDDS